MMILEQRFMLRFTIKFHNSVPMVLGPFSIGFCAVCLSRKDQHIKILGTPIIEIKFSWQNKRDRCCSALKNEMQSVSTPEARGSRQQQQAAISSRAISYHRNILAVCGRIAVYIMIIYKEILAGTKVDIAKVCYGWPTYSCRKLTVYAQPALPLA